MRSGYSRTRTAGAQNDRASPLLCQDSFSRRQVNPHHQCYCHWFWLLWSRLPPLHNLPFPPHPMQHIPCGIYFHTDLFSSHFHFYSHVYQFSFINPTYHNPFQLLFFFFFCFHSFFYPYTLTLPPLTSTLICTCLCNNLHSSAYWFIYRISLFLFFPQWLVWLRSALDRNVTPPIPSLLTICLILDYHDVNKTSN